MPFVTAIPSLSYFPTLFIFLLPLAYIFFILSQEGEVKKSSFFTCVLSQKDLWNFILNVPFYRPARIGGSLPKKEGCGFNQ